MDFVVQLVANLGVPAVLAWYLYHTTVVSFPSIIQSQNAALERITKTQNDTVERVSKDFTVALNEERIVRREEMMMLREEIRYQRQREKDSHEEEKGDSE